MSAREIRTARSSVTKIFADPGYDPNGYTDPMPDSDE